MQYTPSQVSEMLEIPASTLSRYARQFREHLSESARASRRTYSENDLVILGKVRGMISQGVPLEEITDRLHIIETILPPENTALQLIPSLTRELERAQSNAREALALVEVLKSQVDRLPELERRLQALENELQEYRAAPWYKRIFRR